MTVPSSLAAYAPLSQTHEFLIGERRYVVTLTSNCVTMSCGSSTWSQGVIAVGNEEKFRALARAKHLDDPVGDVDASTRCAVTARYMLEAALNAAQIDASHRDSLAYANAMHVESTDCMTYHERVHRLACVLLKARKDVYVAQMLA